MVRFSAPVGCGHNGRAGISSDDIFEHLGNVEGDPPGEIGAKWHEMIAIQLLEKVEANIMPQTSTQRIGKYMINVDNYLEKFLNSPFIGIFISALLTEYAISKIFKRDFSKNNLIPWYLLFFGIRIALKGIF